MSFRNWSMADVHTHNARVEKRAPDAPSEGVMLEAELHNEILEECRRRGWIALHGSTAHRTHRTVGEPDFTILADNGLVLFVECKTRRGKLTHEQQTMLHWASKLRHEIFLVRCFEDFLELINRKTKPATT